MTALNESNFNEQVVNSSVPVLVDFWATWCGPCLHLTPILDKVEKDMEGVLIGKVNVEEEQALAAKYNISAIPALLFFKDGKVVDRMTGIQAESTIKATLESLK